MVCSFSNENNLFKIAKIQEEIDQTYDVGHSERLKRLLKKNGEHAIWDVISKKTDWMVVISKGLLQADNHALTLQVDTKFINLKRIRCFHTNRLL